MKAFFPVLSLVIASLFPAPAHSGDFDPAPRGRDEALRACETIDVVTHRRQCREEAGRGLYFEDAASRACGTLKTSYRVTECIVAIRNRRYSEQEVRSCWSEDFEHEKVECLKALGTPAFVHRAIRLRLEEVLRALESYDWYRARVLVRDLLDSLPQEGN